MKNKLRNWEFQRKRWKLVLKICTLNHNKIKQNLSNYCCWLSNLSKSSLSIDWKNKFWVSLNTYLKSLLSAHNSKIPGTWFSNLTVTLKRGSFYHHNFFQWARNYLVCVCDFQFYILSNKIISISTLDQLFHHEFLLMANCSHNHIFDLQWKQLLDHRLMSAAHKIYIKIPKFVVMAVVVVDESLAMQLEMLEHLSLDHQSETPLSNIYHLLDEQTTVDQSEIQNYFAIKNGLSLICLNLKDTLRHMNHHDVFPMIWIFLLMIQLQNSQYPRHMFCQICMQRELREILENTKK